MITETHTEVGWSAIRVSAEIGVWVEKREFQEYYKMYTDRTPELCVCRKENLNAIQET